MRITALALIVVLAALAAVVASGCGPAATGASLAREQATRKPTADAKPLSVPLETAVDYAVRFARSSDPAMRPQLVGDPTEIRGRVMTYPEADRLTRPAAISPSTPHWSLLDEWAIGQDRDRLVWLIEVRGAFQKLYSKSEPNRRQEIVMLDARTAQVLGFLEREAGDEVDTSSLPWLSMPTGPIPTPLATYTPGPAPIPAPAATKPAAPPVPSPTPSASQASPTVTCQEDSARTPASSRLERSLVSGRVVSVAPDQIVVRTADQGCATLPLSLYEIWENLWVKDIPIEIGDDVTEADPGHGVPRLYVNIVNLQGVVSNTRQEAGATFFDVWSEGSRNSVNSVRVEPQARVSGSGPRENQSVRVIGRGLKDGSVLATTVFLY